MELRAHLCGGIRESGMFSLGTAAELGGVDDRTGRMTRDAVGRSAAMTAGLAAFVVATVATVMLAAALPEERVDLGRAISPIFGGT